MPHVRAALFGANVGTSRIPRARTIGLVKQTIFEVEDDRDIAQLVRQHLEGAGFGVRAFPGCPVTPFTCAPLSLEVVETVGLPPERSDEATAALGGAAPGIPNFCFNG